MSTKRKNLPLNTTSVNLGCRHRKTKLFKIFPSKPNPKPKSTLNNILLESSSSSLSSSSSTSISSSRSSSTSGDCTTTTTSTSYHIDDTISDDTKSEMKSNGGSSPFVSVKLGFGRVKGEGIAIEKDSDDPYLDFKHSMLQMIVENEIYSKDDLRELLRCFLVLNSPYFHGTIIKAFTEIWNGVFSFRSGPLYHP